MSWDGVLRKSVLGKNNSAQRQIERFVRAQIPPFRPETNAAKWRKRSEDLRRAALRNVYLRGYASAIVNAKPKVQWGEVLEPDKSYRICKLRYEAYPDYWVPALLYEPTNLRGRVPAMLNPNGHHAGGKAVVYKQARCVNLAHRGILALSIEFIGMGELEADRLHNNLAYLDFTGLAGVGLFYLALCKALDVLLSHRNADSKRIGVTGLSGGGWQSIVIASMDARVKLAVPVAGYTSVRARVGCLDDIGDLEQTPVDLTTVLDYQDMTAMLAPRPALLICNETDECCFRTDRAKPLIYDAVRPVYAARGAGDKFQFYSNRRPGTHNYDSDSRSRLYRFLNEQWGLDAPEHDLHGPGEILPERMLNVGLPSNQATIVSLALERGRKLIDAMPIPRTAGERRTLRERLEQVIRLPKYAASLPRLRRGASNSVVRVGPWQLPLSASVRGNDEGAELIVSDAGRAWGLSQRQPGGRSRFVVDLLGTGENRADPRFAMLLDSTGHRLVGIRVAQLLACARAITKRRGRVHLVGENPLSSFTCLLAAALRPREFQSLTLSADYMTLLTPLQWGERYESIQPILCFGFLEVADIPHLFALLESLPCRQYGRESPPVTKEKIGR